LPTASFQKTDFGDSSAQGAGITKISFIMKSGAFYSNLAIAC
jgi:hypothetical protein